ncbi:MAG: hypothetical protein Q9162_007881 [Coniocarpon cinnabarinum]
MSIQLDPLELQFTRPFTQEVTEVLRLHNPTSDPIAFKVKTTAPKQYCVRPNSGRIDSGQDVEVQVLLQAMKEDPPLEMKCRDKFLVQTVAWQEIESSSKSSIQEKKIRVAYLPAPGQNVTGATSTPRKSMGDQDAPPAYSSPVSNAATPARSADASHVPPSGPVSKMESKPEGARSLGDAVATTGNPESTSSTAKSTGITGAAADAASGAAATVRNVIPTTSEDVKAQLASANDQIMRLKEQLQDQTGLRQRKPDASENSASDKSIGSGSSLAQQQHAPSGVPVPVVAALCLISFLLAYLLF